MAKGTNDTLASMFADWNETYTKIVGGFTVPVRPVFKEGDVMTAVQARALNTHRLERAAATANSQVDRGAWGKLPADEQLAKITDYLREYEYSDEVGDGTWGNTVLQEAVQNILADLNKEKLAAFSPAEVRDKLAPFVSELINSPEKADDYRERVEAEIRKILATRHEKRTRTTAADKKSVDITF